MTPVHVQSGPYSVREDFTGTVGQWLLASVDEIIEAVVGLRSAGRQTRLNCHRWTHSHDARPRQITDKPSHCIALHGASTARLSVGGLRL